MADETPDIQSESRGSSTPPKPGGNFTLPNYAFTYLNQSVDRLAQVDPGNIQEVAASQIQLLTGYYTLALNQARGSFMSALIAAGVGLAFFLAAVAFLLLRQLQSVATISLISGALVQVIAGINFYLYGRTTIQLGDFQSRLGQIQRFLLANSVCEGLDGDLKQKARYELVGTIAHSGTT